MIYYKIIYHLIAFIKITFYKLIYRKNLEINYTSTFRKGFTLMMSNNARVKIGNGVFFNNYCSIVSYKSIIIGNDSIFGENVKIYDHNHKFNGRNILIKEQGFSSEEIVIGNNCWIGSNVVLLKNSSIGDNSVIGAGCIINEVIPENSIVTLIKGSNYIRKIEIK